MNAIDIKDLNFAWPGGKSDVLRNAGLVVAGQERVLLRGASGSGKSTLLSVISGVVDVPEGTVTVADTDMGALPASQRDRFRGDHMGLIFQVFNLVPWLSVRDNVMLPCRFSHRRRARLSGPAEAEADRLLSELGLDPKEVGDAKASTLSVGQQQRVAAARALIGAPEVILADEPTSALDPHAKDRFMTLLCACAAESDAALLVVSHDAGLEHHFDRVINISELSSAEGAR